MSRKRRKSHSHSHQATPPAPSFSDVRAQVTPSAPSFSDVRAQVQAQMFESSQVPNRLQTFFSDATDQYADSITQDSVRQEMRANSRKVFLTEGCSNHATFTMAIHTIGSSGPQLTMIPERLSGRSDSDPLAPEISSDERSHIEYEWYHFTQDIDLDEHIRIAVESLQYDGEIFFMLVHDPQIPDSELNIQQIEASRVQSLATSFSDDNIVNGIEFDGLHPSFYHILPKSVNPLLDFHFSSEPVPAKFIIHFSVPRLPDQHRGLPWMQAVLTSIAETKLYEEYHLGAANAAARCSGGVLEHQPNSQVKQGETVNLKPSYQMWNPGEIKSLVPGVTLKQGVANWPCSNYTSYIDSMREKISAGMQTTKAMLTNNFEHHNYSSFRGEMIVYWSLIKFLRKRIGKVILDRLFEAWLRCMSPFDPIIASVLERSHFRPHRIPRSWVWEPIPAYDFADYISALNTAVTSGFMSRKMAVMLLGYDFEQVETERKEDSFGLENQNSRHPESV